MIGIIGNGGHAKVVTDIFLRNNPYETFLYFSKEMGEQTLIDSEQNLQKYLKTIDKWHVAIGDAHIRHNKLEWLFQHHANVISAIHDRSVISDTAKIGAGSSVMAGSIINPYAYVGKGCIINTGCTIDHDCRISDYVNIGPGCHLAGGVNIGEFSILGTGAIVIPNVTIGKHCTIGAGAVVIENIPDGCTAVGVPAKIIAQKKID